MLSIINGSRIRIGTATQTFNDPLYDQLRRDNFNLYVCENAMKWDATEPTRGSITLNGDAWNTINAARESGKLIKAHCLAWHNQVPWWYNALNPTEKSKAMQNHVRTLSQILNGIAFKIDVVNEAIDDYSNQPRQFWQELGGKSAISACFSSAHAGHPTAVLVYNDYGISTLCPKSDAVFAMVKELKNQGVPIHEVGFQTHEDASYMDDAWFGSLDANIKRFQSIGVSVNLSEVDIRIDTLKTSLDERFKTQATCFYKLFKTALTRIDEITLWGFSSKYTWIYNFVGCDHKYCPCPWDNANLPLPAVASILQAIKDVFTPVPKSTGVSWEGFGCSMNTGQIVTTKQRAGNWSGPYLSLRPSTRYTLKAWVVCSQAAELRSADFVRSQAAFGVTMCCGSVYTHIAENLASGWIDVTFTTGTGTNPMVYLEGPLQQYDFILDASPLLNGVVETWRGFGCEIQLGEAQRTEKRAATWAGPRITNLKPKTVYTLKGWVVSPQPFGLTLFSDSNYTHVAENLSSGYVTKRFVTGLGESFLYLEGPAPNNDFTLWESKLTEVGTVS